MTIFWDWNGTLVDDVDTVVKINNQVFALHGYPPTTAEDYRRLFRFPVIEYYRDLGVTDEDFRLIAKEWNEGFVEAFPQVPLKKNQSGGYLAAGAAFIPGGHGMRLRTDVAFEPEETAWVKAWCWQWRRRSFCGAL